MRGRAGRSNSACGAPLDRAALRSLVGHRVIRRQRPVEPELSLPEPAPAPAPTPITPPAPSCPLAALACTQTSINHARHALAAAYRVSLPVPRRPSRGCGANSIRPVSHTCVSTCMRTSARRHAHVHRHPSCRALGPIHLINSASTTLWCVPSLLPPRNTSGSLLAALQTRRRT